VGLIYVQFAARADTHGAVPVPTFNNMERLVACLAKFAPLGLREQLQLGAAEILPRIWRPREEILRPGPPPATATVLLSGIACRYTLLPNGSRQITTLLLPGDIVGLECSLHWPCLDTVATLTSVQAAQIPARAMVTWMERVSPLSQLLWQIKDHQAAVTRQWVVNVGTRPALERVAHFFCETLTRARALGICAGTCCELPLTQIELADITAITPVHVNRVLMKLRHDGLARFKSGRLEIPNLPALRKLSGFDPTYLRPLRDPEAALDEDLRICSG
jgi:CRP-like cAMP-binding protein